MGEGKPAAQIAYETYAARRNWINSQGLPMPPWQDAPRDIQEGWAAAVSCPCGFSWEQHMGGELPLRAPLSSEAAGS